MHGVEFKLVLDFFLTATAAEADVVMPMSSPLESPGTLTACDRRVQHSAKIVTAPGGMTNLEIIGKLAEKLGMRFSDLDAEKIFQEIRQANPFYRTVMAGGFWGEGLFRERIPTASGKAKFLPVIIDLTPCSREKQPLLVTENYLLAKIKNKLML